MLYLVSGGTHNFDSIVVMRLGLLFLECFREQSLSHLQTASVLLRLVCRREGWDCPFLLQSRLLPLPPKLRQPPLFHQSPSLCNYHHSFRFPSSHRSALSAPDVYYRHGTVVCARCSLIRVERERQAFSWRIDDHNSLKCKHVSLSKRLCFSEWNLLNLYLVISFYIGGKPSPPHTKKIISESKMSKIGILQTCREFWA